jgi:hypothetical protein
LIVKATSEMADALKEIDCKKAVVHAFVTIAKEKADSEQLADLGHHEIHLHDVPCKSSGPASQSIAQGKAKETPKQRPKESISTSNMLAIAVGPAFVPFHHPSTAEIYIGCVVLPSILVLTVLLLRSPPLRTTACAMLVAADMFPFLVLLIVAVFRG